MLKMSAFSKSQCSKKLFNSYKKNRVNPRSLVWHIFFTKSLLSAKFKGSVEIFEKTLV